MTWSRECHRQPRYTVLAVMLALLPLAVFAGLAYELPIPFGTLIGIGVFIFSVMAAFSQIGARVEMDEDGLRVPPLYVLGHPRFVAWSSIQRFKDTGTAVILEVWTPRRHQALRIATWTLKPADREALLEALASRTG